MVPLWGSSVSVIGVLCGEQGLNSHEQREQENRHRPGPMTVLYGLCRSFVGVREGLRRVSVGAERRIDGRL